MSKLCIQKFPRNIFYFEPIIPACQLFVLKNYTSPIIIILFRVQHAIREKGTRTKTTTFSPNLLKRYRLSWLDGIYFLATTETNLVNITVSKRSSPSFSPDPLNPSHGCFQMWLAASSPYRVLYTVIVPDSSDRETFVHI